MTSDEQLPICWDARYVWKLMSAITNLDLLGIQAEANLDARGREIDVDGITIASCEHGQLLRVGTRVPEPVADELMAAFAGADTSNDPAEPPAALAPCRRILERCGSAVRCKAGPSYL